MTLRRISLTDYRAMVSKQVGRSDWYRMTQDRIDQFAEVTGDRQFIHIDAEAASRSPFGGTIAHGFLSLSMLSAMAATAIPPVQGAHMGVNYGMNSLRFLKPVASGKRIRGLFHLANIQERATGQWQSTFNVTVEIEGEEKPALVAEWLTLMMISSS